MNIGISPPFKADRFVSSRGPNPLGGWAEDLAPLVRKAGLGRICLRADLKKLIQGLLDGIGEVVGQAE